MVKILYVHNSLDLGGGQSVRYMFLKHLDTAMFAVNICCLGAKGEFGRRIEGLGYKVDAFNRPYGFLSFLTTWKLYRYIKRHEFDIVHASLFYANYHSAIAAKLAGVRLLVTEEHGEHNLHWKRRHFIYRRIGRWVASASDLIFCCSDFVKRGVQKMYGIKEGKLRVLKNLMEDKRAEIKLPSEAIRLGLDIPRDAFVMGTVSSLYWIKNQKALIDVLAQSQENNLFLVLVGDGPLKNELLEYAQTKQVSRKVRFTGWRSDVADILNSFDVFMLPSLSEGLPISLLEAMSVGLPCIASNVGGIPEVIEDGKNGMLVPAADIPALSAAVRAVIKNAQLSSGLGLSARRRVLDLFGPSQYVDRVVGSYDRLIKAGRIN